MMIRLTAIELQDFKNVGRGFIALSSFGPNPEDWKSDVIGIYGQNGSGKTSVILALCVLKSVWDTGSLPGFCGDCVAAGRGSFAISVDAVAHTPVEGHQEYAFSYSLEVGFADGRPIVEAERLSYRNLANGKAMVKTAFDYRRDNDDPTLRPVVAWDALCATDRAFSVDAAVARKLAAKEGCSLLMSESFGALLQRMEPAFRGRVQSGRASKASVKAFDDVWHPSVVLRRELRVFAQESLSIVTPSRQAEPMLNIMRISTHEGDAGRSADAYFGINLSEPAFVPDALMGDLRATISTISTVMGALVPGLSLSVASMGASMDEDGNRGERVEISATRGAATVPLRAESEGIKKLVAILVLLVDVYAKPGCCVAIDELDSGVFEFLLGEILQVLQDHGRGQLIFTAHNLRPLETLDKASLVFTTTNPNNRYVTFKGVKATSNFRSQYLRAINLGGQPETVYEATSKFEIDSAFYDASGPED